MPGESEAPEEHLYLFDLSDNSRKEIKTNRFKNQTLSVGYRPRQHKQRSMHDVPNIWLGDDKTFYVTRSSRDLHRIDICSYTIGQDSIVPVIEERMNTYQEVRPLALVGDKPDEVIQWSERDGWAHLYLYDGKGNMKRQTQRVRGTCTISLTCIPCRVRCISPRWDATRMRIHIISISIP